MWCLVLLNGDDRGGCAGNGIAKERQGDSEHAARRRRTPYGPDLGAGVWLKSCSSATQVKFAAMLVLPFPVYFARMAACAGPRVLCDLGEDAERPGHLHRGRRIGDELGGDDRLRPHASLDP